MAACLEVILPFNVKKLLVSQENNENVLYLVYKRHLSGGIFGPIVIGRFNRFSHFQIASLCLMYHGKYLSIYLSYISIQAKSDALTVQHLNDELFLPFH